LKGIAVWYSMWILVSHYGDAAVVAVVVVVAAEVVAAVVDIHDASLTAAAGNILLVDVENACLVVRGHASF
jgi:hypothetical protein